MRLISFSVTNFRSITSAHRLPISRCTVLIGRNNEGKSNLLRALDVAMICLKDHARHPRLGQRFVRRPITSLYQKNYDWERDFPVSLQHQTANQNSVFRLEFQLSDEEIREFKDSIKSNLNGTLPLEIQIGRSRVPKIRVVKKGKGAKTLSNKSGTIARFVSDKLHFNYIPAIRTPDKVLKVVQEMIQDELVVLEDDPAYDRALRKIAKIQKPLLDKVANKIKGPLQAFIPQIKDVTVRILEDEQRFALRRPCEIVIDDGTPTSIEFKGDGLKSLAALSLLKDKDFGGGASIIAIEEPESHLHPGSIHGLRNIIHELSEDNQVIITTHNPIFVDRMNVRNNIIIELNKANPAKNVQVIRNVLGVKTSDNLVNADFVLVVEGSEDVTVLKGLLPQLSPKIGKAIVNGVLIIEPIGGAGNLSYKLTMLSNALCRIHVLLDNDDAGRTAYEKARGEGMINVADCTFVRCKGMSNSELEDCVKPSLYESRLRTAFGVRIMIPPFRTNDKWSDRMAKVFERNGKLWDDKTEQEVKAVVARCVADSPDGALLMAKRSSIDALVSTIEEMIC